MRENWWYGMLGFWEGHAGRVLNAGRVLSKECNLAETMVGCLSCQSGFAMLMLKYGIIGDISYFELEGEKSVNRGTLSC